MTSHSRLAKIIWHGSGVIAVIVLEIALTLLLANSGEAIRTIPGLLYLYLLVVSLAALVWTLPHALLAVVLAIVAEYWWVLPPEQWSRYQLDYELRATVFAAIAVFLAIFESRSADHRAELRTQYELERQRYEQQRDVAQTLQRALLPKPRQIPGYEMAFLYEPASKGANVGGDFLDVFEVSPGRIGLLLGDVAGHGLEAAVWTAQVQYSLKAYAHQGLSTLDCAAAVNAVVYADKRSSSGSGIPDFATFFFGILETTSHTITYCTAGQEPGLLWRSSKNQVDRLHTGGVAVGVVAPHLAIYSQDSVTLDPGDVLLLFTDGITEARCHHELYGPTRVESDLQEVAHRPGEQAVRDLYEKIRAFSCGDLVDDVAMLWVHRPVDPNQPTGSVQPINSGLANTLNDGEGGPC